MATEQVFAAAPVSIGRGLVASSFQYYLTGAESLQVEIWNHSVPATIGVSGRLWRQATADLVTFQQLFPTIASPLVVSETLSLAAGALINLRVFTDTPAIPVGLIFVRVRLLQGAGAGATVIGTLLQGYIGSNNDLGWPGSPIVSMHDGRGAIVAKTPTILTGPLRAELQGSGLFRWRLVSMAITLATSAVAGNRYLLSRITNLTGAAFFFGVGPPAQGPSTTVFYAIAAGMPPSNLVVDNTAMLPWPTDAEISDVQFISIAVDGADAGDVLTSRGCLVRQWIDE